MNGSSSLWVERGVDVSTRVCVAVSNVSTSVGVVFVEVLTVSDYTEIIRSNCALQPKAVTLSREGENEGHEGFFWGHIPSLHGMREFLMFW